MTRIRDSGILVLILSLLNFSQLWVEAGKIEVKCPEFCQCDIFENLKRAVCQNRRLVSMELDIPPQAEILDLSENQISELGDKIFLNLGLTNLKLLNLSHNKIRSIHFNGFVRLENVKTLDLSFNAIEYFTQSWFESLQSLEEFYLRGNKLRQINEEAVMDINTLRVLDISKCGITSLKANTFKQIQNLEILDISDNYIQKIQVDLMKTLPKLTNLKAVNNNFNCKDNNLVQVRNYVKLKKIQFTDSCLIDFETSFTVNQKMHKFKKMQISEDVEIFSATSSTRNSWIFEDNKGNGTKMDDICGNNTNSFNNNADNSILLEIIRLSPWLTITITFVYGVLCGMVFLCAINMCINKKGATAEVADAGMPDGSVSCNVRSTQNIPNLDSRDRRKFNRPGSIFYSTIQKARRQMSHEFLEEDDDDYDETLTLNEFDLANSTPVATRRPFT